MGCPYFRAGLIPFCDALPEKWLTPARPQREVYCESLGYYRRCGIFQETPAREATGHPAPRGKADGAERNLAAL